MTQDVLITSFNQLRGIVTALKQQRAEQVGRYSIWFRGQGSDKWNLENGIARHKEEPRILELESCLLKSFLDSVDKGELPYIQDPPPGENEVPKEWYRYAQGQHLGLKTRLMDWSARWEIGLLFAVANKDRWNEDGHFFVFNCPQEMLLAHSKFNLLHEFSPLNIDQSYLLNLPLYQPTTGAVNIGDIRRMRQWGKFFIQPSDVCRTPIEEQDGISKYFTKFIIDGSSKERIYNDLGQITEDWAYFQEVKELNAKIKEINQSCIQSFQA